MRCADFRCAGARRAGKISEAIEELRLDLVYPAEWRRIDPNELVLKNMNKPEDYEAARKAAKRVRANELVKGPR